MLIIFLGFLGATAPTAYADDAKEVKKEEVKKVRPSVQQMEAALKERNIKKAELRFEEEKIAAAADRIKDESKAKTKYTVAEATLKYELEQAHCREMSRLEKAQERLDYVRANPLKRSWTSVLTLGMLGE